MYLYARDSNAIIYTTVPGRRKVVGIESGLRGAPCVEWKVRAATENFYDEAQVGGSRPPYHVSRIDILRFTYIWVQLFTCIRHHIRYSLSRQIHIIDSQKAVFMGESLGYQH